MLPRPPISTRTYTLCPYTTLFLSNVTLPSGDVLRTVMPAVPYIPEVIRAWTVAMRGLLGAFLISAFITIPLTIWFIDISHRRGRAILQERHERGAMLVEIGRAHV